MSSSRYVVPDDLGGERADKIVAVVADVSRAEARRWIDAGLVAFDGEPVEPRVRMRAGSTIVIEPIAPTCLEPEEIPFDVRYQDDHVAVVEKPAGMVVHPGAGNARGTLAGGLLARWPELRGVGQTDRWGIVHRLDRDVSGLLAIALTGESYENLVAALARRAVTREYRALAHGSFDAITGTIDAPIGRDVRQPARMRVQADGRPSRTHYRRTAFWSQHDVSALDVRLETGRTHQIRVHLATIDHPVVGDRIYGRPGPTGIDPGRVWLHAAHLEFDHPVTSERISVDSPLPLDLRASLERLGAADDLRQSLS